MVAKKIRLISFGLVLIFLGIIGRLAWWQIFNHEELTTQAHQQYRDEYVLPAERGEILFSDGYSLATNQSRFDVYLFKPEIEKDATALAYQLSQLSPNEKEKTVEEERIKDLLESQLVWVPTWKNVTKETVEEINRQDINGIRIQKIPQRYYPEATQAAHLVGFVGKNAAGENQGYVGLEGYYNKQLEGQPGKLIQEEDALGQPIILGDSQKIPPQPGQDLKLFLQRDLQWLLEKKLKAGIEQYGAKQGIGIISSPNNGAILAMSNQPAFDPNQYNQYEQTDFVNSAISQSFEPGSIFKVITMAAALDQDAVTPSERCPICDEPLTIGEYQIKTWNEEYHPNATMSEIIQYSDNVGMAYVGRQLGADNFLKYLEKFGFGEKTNIDLQGESSGLVKKRAKWYPIDLVTTAFGQGIAVTPIQMIQGLNALANGGEVITPRVVKAIKQNDKWHEQKAEKHRVISPQTGREITAMMVNAVELGEAKWTKIPNTKIAGKTGTAQIPIKGHYEEDKTIASFIGYAPADDPQFSMIITLFEPSSSQWAAETAAPLWFDIAQQVFLLKSINPR